MFKRLLLLLLCCCLLYPLHAIEEPEAEYGVLRVHVASAPAKLGDDTLGYLPRGAVLRPTRQQGGFYLVEIRIDGMFRSMAWVDTEHVSLERMKASELPDQPAYAFAEEKDLEKNNRNVSLEQYVVTGHYDRSSRGSDATDADIARHEKASDEELLKSYRKQVQATPNDENAQSVVGLEKLPEDLDMSKAVHSTSKGKDPIVSKTILPQNPNIDTGAEKTYGRAEKTELKLTKQEKIGAVIMLGVVGLVLLYFLVASTKLKKKKKLRPKVRV